MDYGAAIKIVRTQLKRSITSGREYGLIDISLPRDSGYFLTAYNLGKKVAG